MKQLIKYTAALVLLILASYTANAQKVMVTDTFTVAGNCEMCKDRIETAVDVKGVKNATWSDETKVMTITYDSARVTLETLQRNIANAGYDTPLFKADNAAYEKLPHCCQYTRRKE